VSQPPPVRGFQSMTDLPQPRANGPAVVSLVLGLVSFCIPVVTGLLAMIFGFVGLKRSRDSNVGGRGPARTTRTQRTYTMDGSITIGTDDRLRTVLTLGDRAEVVGSDGGRRTVRSYLDDTVRGDAAA